MELFDSVLIFWFVLGLVLLVIEVMTPGVIALFFGLGAWVVLLVAAAADVPAWGQWTIFCVSSVVFLAVLRKHVIRWFAGFKTSKKNSLSEPMVAGRYIGQEVDVLEDIVPGRPGAVEFNGTRWQAKAKAGLLKGDRARIVGLEELAFWIEPLAPPAPENPEASDS